LEVIERVELAIEWLPLHPRIKKTAENKAGKKA
jgi:hypothetical protein